MDGRWEERRFYAHDFGWGGNSPSSFPAPVYNPTSTHFPSYHPLLRPIPPSKLHLFPTSFPTNPLPSKEQEKRINQYERDKDTCRSDIHPSPSFLNHFSPPFWVGERERGRENTIEEVKKGGGEGNIPRFHFFGAAHSSTQHARERSRYRFPHLQSS